MSKGVIQFLIGCLLATAMPMQVIAAPANEPTEMWTGKIKDESLRGVAPKSGFIADAATWKEVWTAWRPKEELPKIDFSKQLILVGTVNGPNLVLLRPMKTGDGDVRFVVGGTKIGGPGFGYKLVAISRKGIKSVNGKPIASGVKGVLLIPEKVPSFADLRLEIKLWEYDPFLADVGADLVDELNVKAFSHQEGKKTEFDFAVGTKLDVRKDRNYYITVFVLGDGKRTHIGEKDGTNGLCKVLEGGEPSRVRIIARPVR